MIGLTAVLLLNSLTETEIKNVPPRKLWAFRSVIDKRARIATVALAKDFWISYDATHCSVYKFWKGDVKFNGAVYTTEHGPQPTSDGGSIFENDTEKPVWAYQKGTQVKLFTPKFRGYFFDKTDSAKVTFQYELDIEGQKATLFETPQLMWEANRPVGLNRKFEIGTKTKTGVSPLSLKDVKIGLLQSASAFGVSKEEGIGTSSVKFGEKQVRLFDGNVASIRTWLVPALSQERTVSDLKEVNGERESDEVLALVDSEVPQGGGNQKKDDLREAGLAFRGYQLEMALERIPKLVPNQSPNVNKKVDSVFFLSADDFEMTGRFFVNLTGWIKAPKGGLYQFRLSSDDGSRLIVNGETIINHDGIHAAEPKTGSLELPVGSHPIQIEYFNSDKEAVLQLEWKKPNDAQWEIVPDEAFETLADEVHVVAPGFKKVLDSLWAQRAGDVTPEVGVHPSFTLSTPRPDGFTPRVGGIDFLPNGDLVLCTWDPEGAVFQISGVQTGDPSKVKVKEIAKGLAEPLGIKYWNGHIYVLQKQELTKLVDNNGDGLIDEYYALANNFGVTENFHEFSFGLVIKDGFFYGTLAIAIDPGGRSTQKQEWARGRVLKINAKTGDFEYVASGLRTPNGISLSGKGEIFLTDNQGDWTPSCKLIEFTPGAFYGNRSVEPEKMKDAPEVWPTCWFPQGEIGNSTSQPAPFEYGPYKGQMIVGDVTHGGLKRVFMEKVEGRYQGTAFRMTQGLEAGINRVIIGPDKAIYVGGIGSTGNWGQEGKERFGLQRLAYNGKSTFEMLSVKPAKNGAEIEFTEPISADLIPLSLDEYVIQQWTYKPTVAYGGPKIDEEKLKVKGITMSSDRKRMFLEFDGIKKNRVVYFRMPASLRSANGTLLWATEAWSTVNAIPNRVGKLGFVATKPTAGGLSATEAAEGFKSIFDGTGFEQLRGYKRQDLPKGWAINDGALTFVPGLGGGDLVTKEQYKDFELRLEWKIAPGGNSGVMYRVKETRGAPYETGIEMQVLDDAKHGDGKNPLTSAGSAYGLIAPSKKTVHNAGEWNQARIVAKGSKIEHWLNGVKVVEYDRTSEEFRQRLAKSKFKDWPEFAKYDEGHIAFQDHGDLVAYRNIRVKRL
jgi:cytochrome c